jgi:crotonobetainyl-CoA:carnitine CoA-transferase CaiB-like acyl-CoA transferase
VIRVERPGGAASRAQPPLHDGISLHFAMLNAGKRGFVVDQPPRTVASGCCV